ncbi:MAG TPA: hypothetical protein DHW79_10800 [Candidatus Cloacimonas sp.]|nr:hypothetical protein [Candidatus Cloacimonas sp.]
MKRLQALCLLLCLSVMAQAFNLDCYSFPNSNDPLQIPTYVPDSDEVCHPDVLYFPQGWNGSKYWMSNTPYPSSNVAFENPSIVVSNDGLNWGEPPGIENPIADVYQGTDINNNYNSDSQLFRYPDGATIGLIWRQKNGWNNELLKLKTSQNGIDWSSASTILSVWNTDPDLNESVLSPCILFNGSSYMLWTVNTKVNPRGVYLRHSMTPDFSDSEAILTDIGEFPEGFRVWHMDVEFIEGFFHMLASVGNPDTQEGRVLYLGKSLDGIHWSFSSQPVMTGVYGAWDALLYRSAFIPDDIGTGYKVWYGSMNTPRWRIGYSESQVNGYLEGPHNLQVDHFYDGQNHYAISWQAPTEDILGYKFYLNYELYATLISSQNHINLTINQAAPHEERVVIAVTALYANGESDPLVERLHIAMSNPQEPALPRDQPGIFPNPFKQGFYLDKASLRGIVELYDLKGRRLMREAPGKDQFIEPDSSLPSGVYLIRFITVDGASHTIKVLKMK